VSHWSLADSGIFKARSTLYFSGKKKKMLFY
jgi:hypothetical protein